MISKNDFPKILSIVLFGGFIFFSSCLHNGVTNWEKQNNVMRPEASFKQSIPLQSFIYDATLSNKLFYASDTIKDSIYINSGLPYFNMPVNSNCFTSGDFGEDTLVFAECHKDKDTLIIELTNPTVCCFYNLTIKIINGQFYTDFVSSYDVSPAMAKFIPVTQKLILKNSAMNSGNVIEGFISYEGKGKYEEGKHAKLTNEEKANVFSQKVSGYFKCKIN